MSQDTITRITKSVDTHKLCFEISLLFPNQGDMLSYFLCLGEYSSYGIMITVSVTVRLKGWGFRLQSFIM